MQGELSTTFIGAFQDSVHVTDEIILNLITILIELNIGVINLKASICTQYSHTVEAGSWIGKCQHISLKLAWKFFRLEELCS